MEELPGFGDYLLATENRITVEFLNKFDQIREKSDEEFINSLDEVSPEDFLRLLLTRIIDQAQFEIGEIPSVTEKVWDSVQDEDIQEALKSLGVKDLRTLTRRAEEWNDEYLTQLDIESQRSDLIKQDLEFWGEPEFTIQQPKADTLLLESEISGNFVSELSLFDQFKVSEEFPVVWIPNDKQENSLLKVYSDDTSPDVSWTATSVRKNTVYVSIPRSSPNLKPVIAEITENDDAGKSKGNSHVLRIRLDDEKQNIEISERLKSFPFELPELTALKAIFTFAIHYPEPVEINLESLLLAVTTDGRLARYLHILESSSTPSRDSVKMRYTFPFPSASLSFVFRVLGNQILASTRGSREPRSSRESFITEAGTGFLEIRVEVENSDIERYIEILARLFQGYLSSQSTADLIIQNYLGVPLQTTLMKAKTRTSLASSARSRLGRSVAGTPMTSSTVSRARSVVSSRSVGNTDIWSFFERGGKETIEDLRKIVDLPADYTKACTAGARPHILKANKVKEWEKQRFVYAGKEYKSLALPFPSADNPKIYLGCPYDTTPFIGIRVSKTTKDIIPCCYREDKNTEGGPLNRYLKGEDVSFIREFGGPPKSDSGLLNFKDTNKLPVPAEQLLENELPARKEKYLKLGMVRSKSSFLHALYLCVEFEEYKRVYFGPSNEKTEKILETIIEKQREKMATDVTASQLALTKEALPDRSFEDVRRIIRNPKKYFDPRIFVRLAEAIFKIRILLIEAEAQQIEIVQNYARMFVGSFPLEVSPPDDEKLPSRSPLVVLIGQVDKDRGFIQWEPVFQPKTKTLREIILKFSTREGNLLADFLIRNLKTYQANLGIQNLTLRENNWFNVKDFIKRFQGKGFKPTGQKIDGLGKCRVIFFEKNKKSLKFMIPPVSPLALPLLKESRNNSNLDFLPDVKEILKDQQIQAYQNENEKIWKLQWGQVYLPIEMYVKPTTLDPSVLEKIQVISSPEETFENWNIFSRVAQLKKTASRLEKISSFIFTKWLIDREIEFFASESEIQDKLLEWEEEIIIEDDQKYDFTILYGQYPDYEYPDLLDFLTPTGISDGESIIFPSEEIKNRTFSFIRRWMANRLFEILGNIIFDEIPSFYEFPGDFSPSENVRIYKGREISAREVFTQEVRNNSLPRIVQGPYNYFSLLFPCSYQSEAEIRCQNWILHKVNTDVPLKGVVDNPKIEIFDFDNLKGTIGKEIEGEDLPVIILREQIAGRGAVKTSFYAVLLLGKV